MKYTLIFGVAVILLIIATSFVYSGNVQTVYEIPQATSTPIVRDNIEKLTDNLEAKMRQVENSKAILGRAEVAHNTALEIYNKAVEEYNAAIDAINLYQGM